MRTSKPMAAAAGSCEASQVLRRGLVAARGLGVENQPSPGGGRCKRCALREHAPAAWSLRDVGNRRRLAFADCADHPARAVDVRLHDLVDALGKHEVGDGVERFLEAVDLALIAAASAVPGAGNPSTP